MSDNKTVTFTAWLKDMASGPLDKMSRKGKAAFEQMSRGIAKFTSDGKKVSLTIEQIDNEIKKLNSQRITLHVDSSDFKRVTRELNQLTGQKRMIEGSGLTSKAAGLGVISKAGIYGAAIAAAYKGVQLAKSSIGEFDKSEKVNAQLGAGLKSTGGISGKTIGGMSSQAENLQKITLFDDETTKNAQGLLLTFTKVRGEVFDKSIPLMQDLATRMGGGPESLSSAALQVGKALNDPIGGVTALRRMGVQLDDQQKKQIKTFMDLGQIEKAQAVILKELQTEFGGSAQAAAKAGTGGLTILGNKFDDIKERIGKSITPTALAIGDLAGETMKLAKANPSADIQREKQMFIQLSAAVANENLTEERRRDILKQMRDIQPGFLEGLNLESVGYEQVRDAIDSSISMYDRRISYLEAEAKALEAINKVQEYNNELTSLRQSQAESNVGSMEQQMDSFLTRAKTARVAQSMDGMLDVLGWSSKLLTGTSISDRLQKSNQQLQQEGEKLLERQKLVAEYTQDIMDASKTGDLTILNAFEKKLKSMGVTSNMMAKFKEQYAGLGNIDDPTNPAVNTGGTGGSNDPLDPDLKTINGDISKVKNINITIHKLGGDITYTNSTVKESASDLKDQITEVLLTALNDANLAGGD